MDYWNFWYPVRLKIKDLAFIVIFGHKEKDLAINEMEQMSEYTLTCSSIFTICEECKRLCIL